MDVEVTKLPESRVALKIELGPPEVEQALDRTYKNLVQRVNIPGFRKGKAPRPVVERAVGRELFLHEATDEAVRWGYRKAIEQEKLVPIDEAEIQPEADGHEHVVPGDSFRFEATVTVRPEVRLPDYHALKVERESTDVSDEAVDNLLQELRDRYATLEPVVRSAQLGDVVTMNVTARVGSDEVLEDENYDFELRTEEEGARDARFPGLSAELAGANRGDIREIALPLPDEYMEPEHAGQTMLLRVLIKEIKRRVLPEADDEFAQTVGEFETINELRSALRENLEAERKLEVDQKLVNDAIEAVSSRTFVEIPQVLIDEELDRRIDELREQIEASRINFDIFLQATNRTVDDLRNEMRESAIQSVKNSLMLGAVAEAEAVEISNGEVNAELDALFREANVSQAEQRRIRSSSAARSSIRTRLRRRKAIERLVEIVGGGEGVSAEATDAAADQTTTADGTEENLAVEVAG